MYKHSSLTWSIQIVLPNPLLHPKYGGPSYIAKTKQSKKNCSPRGPLHDTNNVAHPHITVNFEWQGAFIKGAFIMQGAFIRVDNGHKAPYARCHATSDRA